MNSRCKMTGYKCREERTQSVEPHKKSVFSISKNAVQSLRSNVKRKNATSECEALMDDEDIQDFLEAERQAQETYLVEPMKIEDFKYGDELHKSNLMNVVNNQLIIKQAPQSLENSSRKISDMLKEVNVDDRRCNFSKERVKFNLTGDKTKYSVNIDFKSRVSKFCLDPENLETDESIPTPKEIPDDAREYHKNKESFVSKCTETDSTVKYNEQSTIRSLNTISSYKSAEKNARPASKIPRLRHHRNSNSFCSTGARQNVNSQNVASHKSTNRNKIMIKEISVKLDDKGCSLKSSRKRFSSIQSNDSQKSSSLYSK